MIQFSKRGCGRIEFLRCAATVALIATALPVFARGAEAATITPPEAIAQAGKIVFCSDMTGPPLEFLDESTKPIGSDIDLGREIAKRFGVKDEWNNLPFKGLIPALLAKQCDAVISQLFDKPERREAIGLVDYMNSSEALLVAPGTGTPEIGGLTTREALAFLRGLRGINLVGADLVEVAPQYDATSNTAHAGAQVLFEILSLFVK